MKNKSYTRLVSLIQLSVLIALVIIFSYTGIGYIKAGAVEITLNVLPVAIAAIVLGPSAGAVCGGVFGLTSFTQCFGMSAFGAALLSINPVFTFIMCFVPRVLTGLFTGFVFKAFKNEKAGCALSSLACPLMNTLMFVSSLIIFFRTSDFFRSLYESVGAKNIFTFFIAFVGINGAVEAAACFIISSAVSAALLKTNKQLRR